MNLFAKKTSSRLIFLFLSSLIASPVIAGEVSNMLTKNLTLQLGYFDAYQGESQHIGIQGLVGNEYNVTDHHDQNILAGIGYYINGVKKENILLKYGINVFYLAPTTVSGDITQENLFTNLSYHYKLTNYPIYFDAKTFFNINKKCPNITLDIGIGPNIIRSSGYSERSLDGITIPDNAFSGTTEVAFSATAGLGVSFCFNHKGECLPIELGYRFFYLGEGKLDKESSQINNDLTTGHSYANALMLSVFI